MEPTVDSVRCTQAREMVLTGGLDGSLIPGAVANEKDVTDWGWTAG